MQHQTVEAIAPDLFRSLMRRIASSVAVITTAHDGHLHGMTATAVSSVSADPPRLLIVVNQSTRSHPLIAASKTFVVNILADSQRALGERFSSKVEDQFKGVEYTLGWHGAPILTGAAAHLECRLVGETDMVSHTIFIGQIVGGGVSGFNPLLYHDGAYKALTPRVSSHEIAPFFLERWSPRAFSDETITDAEMMQFFEAAHWAPSSMNVQPWRFVFVRRGEEGWQEVLDGLSRTNRSWAFRAAALIAFVSRNTMEYGGQTIPSPTHSFDTGAAWMSFALQAYLAGWHTHGMAGFDHDKLRATLNVPDDHTINAVAAIGKIGDRSVLDDALRAREVPNEREPVEKLVFKGRMPD